MASDTSASNPSPVPSDVKERLKASYDIIAPKYSAWTLQHPAQRLEYLDKILALLPLSDPPSRPLRILELGCGPGLPVTRKLLSYPTVRVTANDISTVQIELARANLLGAATEGNSGDAEREEEERLTLVEGDMAKLAFPDGSFDAVVAFYSLIHLPRAEQTEMIGKIARWLKPGGYLLANFAEGEAEAVVMEKWLDEKGWAFWSGWGKEETLRIIGEAGLQVVVGEVTGDVVDASFLWVIAKQKNNQ
ncbi:S-adenosyl-L-methionine-dependent methyltransferase [Hypoxylon rubiginosum]|uniref:S-adenosyl-L-methionine-dependent methyltransferase n=1 Tax=Hypoxylon rubiginosum TaxID=110542 RepID=A0ACB9ZG96_9PEZI|nr:S-adenosyl-L-methionine-dependent methyltransferase [Hypoxylon rubiginosum]